MSRGARNRSVNTMAPTQGVAPALSGDERIWLSSSPSNSSLDAVTPLLPTDAHDVDSIMMLLSDREVMMTSRLEGQLRELERDHGDEQFHGSALEIHVTSGARRS